MACVKLVTFKQLYKEMAEIHHSYNKLVFDPPQVPKYPLESIIGL